MNVESPILELRNVHKAFGSHVVLRGLSLSVQHGEVVALVGESGSGKSTAARIVAGLEHVTSGEVLFSGQPLRAQRTLALRQSIQMVFQDPFGSLNPVHTILHHLERPLRRHKRCQRSDVRAKSLELLEAVGLSPAADYLDSYPHSLSGGQKQRVAIARALAPGPTLVLADEPTSMLDVSIRIEILNLIDSLRRERGLSWLFITHDLASARDLADRIIVLEQGEIVESGPAAEVLDNPTHDYTKTLMAAATRGSRARKHRTNAPQFEEHRTHG